MKLSFKNYIKILLYIWLFLWFILWIHIFYVYLIENSNKNPSKWWTFVEWWLKKISYLPYTSNSDYDKFYQSFLYNSCLTPYVSWTEILFKEDLCKVETENYKVFNIKLVKDVYWSDWKKLDLDDIFFTYDLLINNYWNLDYLKIYKWISITKEKDYIKLVFPLATKDNLIFFTNYILPKHILENKDLDYYLWTFWFNPVVSNCWRIKVWIDIVFDLTKCWYYINNYQYKQFANEEELLNYIKSNKKKIIDFYRWKKLTWYKENIIYTNDYVTIFFNVNSQIDLIFKNRFIKTLDNILTWNDYFVKVFDFFNINLWDKDLKYYFDNKENIKEISTNIMNLPKRVNLINNLTLSYYLDAPTKVEFRLPIKCDKVWVIYRWSKYYVKSYDANSNVFYFNFWEDFKNINYWQNLYIISCERWLKFNNFSLEIWYKNKPTKSIQINKIKILYLEDEAINHLISEFKKYLKENWIEKYFDFIWVKDVYELDPLLNKKEYDILIRWLYLWIKRDISSIFQTDDPLINPSLYKNSTFASLYSKYTINKDQKLFDEINKIYNQNLPLVFIWKYIDKYIQRDDLKDLYPKRLYSWWLRKDYIKEVVFYYTPVIDSSLFSIRNFFNWIIKILW